MSYQARLKIHLRLWAIKETIILNVTFHCKLIIFFRHTIFYWKLGTTFTSKKHFYTLTTYKSVFHFFYVTFRTLGNMIACSCMTFNVLTLNSPFLTFLQSEV